MICAIFAVDEKGGMGFQDHMPWPGNKEDMAWFKKMTQDQVVVMGKKTWESSDMPKPLPGRYNVLFSNNFIENDEIQQIRGNVCEGLKWVEHNMQGKSVFVIGGPNLLEQSKPVIEKAYITKIPGEYISDTSINLDEFLDVFKLVNTINLESCTVEEYERI